MSSPEEPLPEPQPGTCEFTPCNLTATLNPNVTHPQNETQAQPPTEKARETRKVISHIFGRNKTHTKRMPARIWVHYCRQHYQRARYRSRNWGVSQCELVLVSLGRMRSWGAVGGFRVVLRRREVLRVSSSTTSTTASADGSGSASWAGSGVDGDDPGDENGTSNENQNKGQNYKQRKTRSTTFANKQSPPAAAATAPTPTGRRSLARKKPTIPSAPVPAWLRAEASPTRIRSFDEVEGIVKRLMLDLQNAGSGKGSGRKAVEVRFPDVEILPVFKDGE